MKKYQSLVGLVFILIAFLGFSGKSTFSAEGYGEGNLFLIVSGPTSQAPDVNFLNGKLECEDLFPATGKYAARDLNDRGVSPLHFYLYSSLHCKIETGQQLIQAAKNPTEADAFMGQCADSNCLAIWTEPGRGTFLIY